jgi:hypothetical protein
MEYPRSNAFLDVLPHNSFADVAAVKKRLSHTGWKPVPRQFICDNQMS